MNEALARMMATEHLIVWLHDFREMAQCRAPMPGHMTTKDAWAKVKIIETELKERGVSEHGPV